MASGHRRIRGSRGDSWGCGYAPQNKHNLWVVGTPTLNLASEWKARARSATPPRATVGALRGEDAPFRWEASRGAPEPGRRPRDARGSPERVARQVGEERLHRGKRCEGVLRRPLVWAQRGFLQPRAPSGRAGKCGEGRPVVLLARGLHLAGELSPGGARRRKSSGWDPAAPRLLPCKSPGETGGVIGNNSNKSGYKELSQPRSSHSIRRRALDGSYFSVL